MRSPYIEKAQLPVQPQHVVRGEMLQMIDPQLRRHAQKDVIRPVDFLRPEFDGKIGKSLQGPHPAADRSGSLEDHRFDPGLPQLLRRAKTGDTRSNDHDWQFHHTRIFPTTSPRRPARNGFTGRHRRQFSRKIAVLEFDPIANTGYSITMSSSPIDWEQLDMIADGFAPDFVEIYREYLAEIPVLLDGLRQKIQENDAVQAARIAHQIKGSSANFGFTGISEPIATIEQEAESGSLGNAFVLLSEAEDGFTRAVAEVKARQGV